MKFHTSQYSRCFIPATIKLWNELPSMTVEVTELQKFKLGANAFLLDVGGLQSAICPSVFYMLLILLTFYLVLLNFLLLFVCFIFVFFSF